MELLTKHLSALSSEEIIEFQRIFDELTDRAHSWDLWPAACCLPTRLGSSVRPWLHPQSVMH